MKDSSGHVIDPRPGGMSLAKAIELLSESAYGGVTCFDQRFKDAEKIGIEAIKWRQQMKKDYGSWVGPLLPGETNE